MNRSGNIENKNVRFHYVGKCPHGRLQIKGTCWFQAIVNGWILSSESRKIMKRKLASFKNSNEMKPYTNIQACPMRGKLPVYFWSYVEYMINSIEGNSKNNSNFHIQVMKNKQFSTNNLIQNVYGWNKNSTEGGTIKSVRMFLELIFPGNWSEEPGKDIYMKKFDGDGEIDTPSGYKICHAYITAIDVTSAHAVTGILCGNDAAIFDSNNPDILHLDWRVKFMWSYLDQYFTTRYNYKNHKIVRYVIYVKTTPSTNLYKPSIDRSKVTKTINITNARNLRNVTNKLTTYNNTIINKYGHGAYTNKKLDELRSKMTPKQIIKSGILQEYTVPALKKITGVNSENHRALYNIAIKKYRSKTTFLGKIKSKRNTLVNKLSKIISRKKT